MSCLISAVLLFYRAKGSNLSRQITCLDSPKQHSGVRRFRGNKKMEITIREWMRMLQPDICCDKIYKPMT